MTLTSGTRLGPYEIVAQIGAGGMGEVYRARDTKLNREVAIKVLPQLFAADPERLVRFTREAQTLAALNHPNIAHIYGVEESGAVRALVMECVDGEDLSAVIARGPLSVEDAVEIGRQIVDALEAAHEHGIVHRDLKPANVKVKADGTVKVLDFGLAKAMDPVNGVESRANPANSPTFTAHATQVGLILGTAAYMAPEQARGKAIDKRVDIWAFGVVLFEMLTGRQAFDGDTISEIMASVMKDDPEWSRLPPGLPPQVLRVLRRCLVKDPRQRLRDIGDARLLLDDAEVPAPSRLDSPASSRGAWAARAAIALSIIAIAAAAGVYAARPHPAQPTVHLSIPLPPGEQATTAPAVSPDGRIVAYASGRTRETSHLYLRSIESPAAKMVEGSLGGQLPFFSPDGRSLGFFAGGKMLRVPVSGGTPTTLADAARTWGGSWCTDGTIVYVPSLNHGLWRISQDGGVPVQLTKPDGAGAGYAHAYPQCLPGGSEVLFSFWGQAFYPAVFSSKSGTWRPVSPSKPSGGAAVIPIYTSDGHLVAGDFATGITAVEWNPTVTQLRNPETVVIDGVYHIVGNERMWLNVSDNGTVVYVPGTPFRRRLVWVDRQGTETPIPGEPDAINEMTVSRDGRRIARRGNLSQWVEDLATGTRTRIISGQLTWQGGWLPGDDRLVVSSVKDGDWDLYTVSASGGELKPLLRKPYTQHPMAVAPDGSVVYFENHPVTGADLWVLAPDGKTWPLANTPFTESSAAVSSDGKYVAYTSDESGHTEVYAIPFSGSGDRVTVSTDGGTGPVWSRDGKELFYRAGDDLVSVEVLSTAPLKLGSRKKLLDVSAYEPAYFHDFDVSADGKRFLFIRSEPDARPTRIDVILNWFPELRRLVQ
jgi:Tol biopolymer transport system component